MSQQGTVKFFNPDKGYGFMIPDDGGRDIFVHIAAVERAGLNSLNEGQRVSYEIEAGKKGKGANAVDPHAILEYYFRRRKPVSRTLKILKLKHCSMMRRFRRTRIIV